MLRSEKDLEKLRHSLSHILAAAIKKVYPKAKLGIGPAIDNGFYYDFDLKNFTEESLAKIEEIIQGLISDGLKFEKEEVTAAKAKKIFAEEPYKLELIEELKKAKKTITVYHTFVAKEKTPVFTDLCAGPHIKTSKEIDPASFKLRKISGAYWKGDEKNKMLTRIYGLAFSNKEELDAYIAAQEEAERRDHRKLGKELDLFVFSDLVGPGLPLYTPKGAAIRREIINFSNELQKAIGYEEVHTPSMNKAELFKVSGHYEKYKEDMFRVVSNYSKEEYFLKPMNCPQHTQIFASRMRSYKDLPIRLADFANLHRDERPGELSGLTRLRCFCQDDGHAFCREDQIKDEFVSVLGAIRKALEVYGMNYHVRLSLWDPKNQAKYLGDTKTWKKSQTLLEEILKENKIEYVKAVGEAAIYGPKMDLISTDSLGREWQISTIQLDFIMPQRFGLKYTDENGKDKTPVMIHRAITGSPERFLGILIEHFAGAFPVWLAPVQVAILPVNEGHIEYAKTLTASLRENDIRFEVMGTNDTLGKRIRESEMKKIPYILVVGDKEMAANTVSVRKRGKGDLGAKNADDFLKDIKEEIKTRAKE